MWKATHDRMLGHNEIATIIQALGTGILDEFDLGKLQYHKIVIMCDADVDGSHIRTLILTFFFRQMPELVKAGHVYIAQPPLFKTKLKGRKKETYHLTEADYQAALLNMGLEGTALVGEGREPIAGAPLAELVGWVEELERLGREVGKKQVPFDKYLARRKDGRLPHARIRVRGGKGAPAVYSKDELVEWLKKAREAEPELKVWRHTDPLAERADADVEITTFTHKKRLEEVLTKLEQAGFFLGGDLFVAPRPDGTEEPPAPFQLRRGKDEQPVPALVELPRAVRALGEKGVEVQRYKGLGEMDAEELEETTMDPAKRLLLQVSLENTLEANQVFSTLMGSKVEPRRAFIERHAAEVTDIDA